MRWYDGDAAAAISFGNVGRVSNSCAVKYIL